MHCSIWTYEGDPDDLVARYEALLADIPAENMRFSACARTPTGIVIFDTCPSKEVYDAFVASDDVQALTNATPPRRASSTGMFFRARARWGVTGSVRGEGTRVRPRYGPTAFPCTAIAFIAPSTFESRLDSGISVG